MDAVVEILGSKRAVALALDITEPAVRRYWHRIPAERVLQLEAVQRERLKKDGKPVDLAIDRHQLRPDLYPVEKEAAAHADPRPKRRA